MGLRRLGLFGFRVSRCKGSGGLEAWCLGVLGFGLEI